MERLQLSNTEMSLQRLLCPQPGLLVMLCYLFEKADKRECNSTINCCLFGQTLICVYIVLGLILINYGKEGCRPCGYADPSDQR